MAKVLRLTAILAVAGFLGASGSRAEDSNPAALATALKDVTTTLQGGLKASEPEGKPISAKFELEDGKLQLSVYVLKGDDFVEVVADPKTAVAKSEKITDADDLKAAAAQKAAGQGGGVAVDRCRHGGKGQYRPPGDQHLSAAAGRTSRGRGYPVTGHRF